MAGVNKAILIGNLGADPEIKSLPSGGKVANFNIATSEQWTNKEGNKEERTEWHRIVAFGKLAEICGEYLSKGRKVYIEGRVQTRSWEDRDGNKNTRQKSLRDRCLCLGVENRQIHLVQKVQTDMKSARNLRLVMTVIRLFDTIKIPPVPIIC